MTLEISPYNTTSSQENPTNWPEILKRTVMYGSGGILSGGLNGVVDVLIDKKRPITILWNTIAGYGLGVCGGWSSDLGLKLLAKCCPITCCESNDDDESATIPLLVKVVSKVTLGGLGRLAARSTSVVLSTMAASFSDEAYESIAGEDVVFELRDLGIGMAIGLLECGLLVIIDRKWKI